MIKILNYIFGWDYVRYGGKTYRIKTDFNELAYITVITRSSKMDIVLEIPPLALGEYAFIWLTCDIDKYIN